MESKKHQQVIKFGATNKNEKRFEKVSFTDPPKSSGAIAGGRGRVPIETNYTALNGISYSAADPQD